VNRLRHLVSWFRRDRELRRDRRVDRTMADSRAMVHELARSQVKLSRSIDTLALSIGFLADSVVYTVDKEPPRES
jgi:hypothetical protein